MEDKKLVNNCVELYKPENRNVLLELVIKGQLDTMALMALDTLHDLFSLILSCIEAEIETNKADSKVSRAIEFIEQICLEDLGLTLEDINSHRYEHFEDLKDMGGPRSQIDWTGMRLILDCGSSCLVEKDSKLYFVSYNKEKECDVIFPLSWVEAESVAQEMLRLHKQHKEI